MAMTPAVSPDAWTPEVWPHTAVVDMTGRLDPALMTRYADDWGREIDRAAAVFADMQGQLASCLAQTWRGAGADASLSAMQRYVAGSLDGLRPCRSVGHRLTQLSHAAGELRAAIVAPADDGSAAQRHLYALQQVRRLYSQPAVAAGNSVEDIPPPPEPFGPRPDPGFGSLPNGAASVPSPPAGVTPQGVPLTGLPSPPALGGAMPGRPVDLSHASGFGSPYTGPTISSGPLVGLPDPDRPTSAAGPGAAPTVATAPLAGAPVPGAPAAPSVAAPSRAGLPFPPYLGPLHPGYAGRDGGGERPVAGYLISIDNGSELIGPLPKVAPPVIGE